MKNMSICRVLMPLAFLLSACSSAPRTTRTPIADPTTMTSSVILATTPSVTPSLLLTATTSPEPKAAAVTVTAVGGNLFIRRGPDLAFDPVGVLMAGQAEKALARDVLGTWLQIHLPDGQMGTGWISIQSHYSTVKGDVMSLPESTPTDWPVLASLRNCTHHQMVTDPGGIVIPSVDNFPANDVQIDPGTYRIHDADIAGSPEVMKVEIREGSAIDIRYDGDGEHKKCPAP